MLGQPRLFGSELRRLRIAAGLSLNGMAALVHYSKGQLSKVETGHKRPSPELARLCDTALEAGGTLAALVRDRPRHTATPSTAPRTVSTTLFPPPTQGEVWPMSEDATDPGEDVAPGRRRVMAAGAASLLSLGCAAPSAADPVGPPLIDAARSLFDHFRTLGQTAGPQIVLPALTAQTRSLCDLAADAGLRARPGLLTISSRYAEFAGWMSQEAGDDGAALRWTERAVALAAAGGDRHLATYALVRRALISFYAEDAAETIALARRAQEAAAPPRIAGLAAQQEAQGHALAGDRTACLHALDRARDLLARPDDDPASPVIGSSFLSDPVSMITGWCRYDLGQPRQAAAALDREVAKLPAHSLRNRARYGVRRALAHAAAGEIEHACSLTRELLGAVTLLNSATITTDLRRLARTLTRYGTHHAVRELSPDLTLALHAGSR
ncbi:helix-turn-helix domain-containing protein [Streptomyces sp. NPDC057555]|uniref:helix-turn-helix domain-containing protein n=1 Tax=Streptomyces sp. NPDC057555 TaxID=3346166 RepID=UPI0036AC257B